MEFTGPAPSGELVIDNFAGGGGASVGIEAAIGRPVDIAINHDPEAVAMHKANHPDTKHYCEDVFHVDPVEACNGRPVGLAWFSPDCTFFSKARGDKPHRSKKKAEKRRGLANVVIKWAKLVKPRIIMLENVEEFKKWGPLIIDPVTGKSKPCPARQGLSFKRWVKSLENLGYKVEYRELIASHYGAPTIRKRLFLVARCDGLPIVWPAPTHGKGLKPFRTAAECIDWTIPCPSIFERKKALAENTLRRIAKGIFRYVINAQEPFIVTYYGPKKENDFRGQSIKEPLATQTTENRHALVVPHIQRQFGNSIGHAITEPNGTITPGGGGKSQLVAAFLTEHANASAQRTFDIMDPLRTQCAEVKGGHFALVSPFLAKHYTGVVGQGLDSPLGTVTAKDHSSLVSAFLVKYYGQGLGDTVKNPMPTITTKDRFGLVIIKGVEYRIIDIGMRMLQPRELYTAQGFPADYEIFPQFNGKPLTKKASTRMCGNSVSPNPATALVKANYQPARINQEVVGF